MRKIYKLEELDCALCAAKLEKAIRKINGVTSASVNFLTQKLTLEAEDADFERCAAETVKLCRKIEPVMKILM